MKNVIDRIDNLNILKEPGRFVIQSYYKDSLNIKYLAVINCKINSVIYLLWIRVNGLRANTRDVIMNKVHKIIHYMYTIKTLQIESSAIEHKLKQMLLKLNDCCSGLK